MSEIHKFLFDGLALRGALVRLDDAWVEILRRRSANTKYGAYPVALQNLLGEMTAAAVLMRANIKFDGSLVLQIFGAGPVKLAAVEVQADWGLRASASVDGTLNADASLSQMVNLNQLGRCAVTLQPPSQALQQQPYQGVIALQDERQQKLEHFGDVIAHYMRQSEQIDTTMVLAANQQLAAGLLLQRLPTQGAGNLAHSAGADTAQEDYRRIALLASSLKRQELLTLDAKSILHRLFWNEKLLLLPAPANAPKPHFSCNCNRQRVARMLQNLGQAEVEVMLQEQPEIEVACDFCGQQYRFDAVDTALLFHPGAAAIQPT